MIPEIPFWHTKLQFATSAPHLVSTITHSPSLFYIQINHFIYRHTSSCPFTNSSIVFKYHQNPMASSNRISSPTTRRNRNGSLPDRSYISPKTMSGVFFILFPICFLVTAALQQAQLVEYIILPAMYNYFTKRDVPYVMAGVCFFWT